jgi:hypothetical protein
MTLPHTRKSPERAAFEHYLRFGKALTPDEWSARIERKFNPYHDERGRFTFGPSSAGMGQGPAGNRPPPSLHGSTAQGPKHASAPRPRAAPEIPGYPETGRTA